MNPENQNPILPVHPEPMIKPEPPITNQVPQKDLAHPIIASDVTEATSTRSKTFLLILLVGTAVFIVGGFGVARITQSNQDSVKKQGAGSGEDNTISQNSIQSDTMSPGNATSPSGGPLSPDSATDNSAPNPNPISPSGNGSGITTLTPKTFNISYTGNCYSPANITIKKGDTIIFTNNSNRDMWPASDVHPTHNIYPEFDSDQDIAPGGTYSFTFTKVGSWGYHDHSKPNCSGIITVQ